MNKKMVCVLLLLSAAAYGSEERGQGTIPDIDINGYIQAGYTAVQNDIQVSTDTFNLRRVRVSLTVHIIEQAFGYIEGDVNTSEIKYGYICYKAVPWFTAQCGKIKMPISAEAMTSGSQLDYIEYSRMVEELVEKSVGLRDIGLKIKFQSSFGELESMVSNGSGVLRTDADERKALSARGIIRVVSVCGGISAYRTTYMSSTAQQEEKRIRYGADIALGNKETGVLKGEYLWGKDGSLKRYGWTISGDMGLPFISPSAYQFIPVRTLVRFEHWDPDKHTVDDGEERITFGVRYPWSEYLRCDVNYTIVQEETRIQNDNNRFTTQVQLKF